MDVPDNKTPLNAAEDFSARVLSEIAPRIHRSTVAIFGVQDDEIPHDRTGVLYRCGDRHFILTAAHKLGETLKHKIPCVVSPNEDDAPPVSLAGADVHYSEDNGRDVAAIVLPPDASREISKWKTFLSHADVRLDDSGDSGLYVLCGFPKEWSGRTVDGKTIRSEPLFYLALPFTGKPDSRSRFDPVLHMLLEFDRSAVDGTTQEGVELPEPHGISGCGVWRVCELSARGLESWSPDDVSLVAIQHRWSGHGKYIMATRIRFMLDFILKNYPELRPAMSLLYRRRPGAT